MLPGSTVALLARVEVLGLVTSNSEPPYGVVSPEGSLINNEANSYSSCVIVKDIVKGLILWTLRSSGYIETLIRLPGSSDPPDM